MISPGAQHVMLSMLANFVFPAATKHVPFRQTYASRERSGVFRSRPSRVGRGGDITHSSVCKGSQTLAHQRTLLTRDISL